MTKVTFQSCHLPEKLIHTVNVSLQRIIKSTTNQRPWMMIGENRYIQCTRPDKNVTVDLVACYNLPFYNLQNTELKSSSHRLYFHCKS